jgi:hypothetical protein
MTPYPKALLDQPDDMFFPILSLERERKKKTPGVANMKSQLSLVFVVMLLCCFAAGKTVAQSQSKKVTTELLNKIQVDQCKPTEITSTGDWLKNLIELEQKRGLVLDARPSRSNNLKANSILMVRQVAPA